MSSETTELVPILRISGEPLTNAAADEIERLRDYLTRIAVPTYGSELHSSDKELADIYWTHLKALQYLAREALGHV
jgi:hypothetical protein